eukprot:COSAG04_NODE_9923_length_820_cov_1.062413_1_plen_33_part_10
MKSLNDRMLRLYCPQLLVRGGAAADRALRLVVA